MRKTVGAYSNLCPGDSRFGFQGMKPDSKPKPVNNIADLTKGIWIGLARKPQWRCLILLTGFAEIVDDGVVPGSIAVVCLVSALAFQGLTDHLPRHVWLAIGSKDWAPKSYGTPIRIEGFRKRCGSARPRPVKLPTRLNVVVAGP
nr:hypothetical protein [Rhizobium leguminosarum]